MTNIPKPAEESNAVPTANHKHNNTAFTASVPDGNDFDSSGEELQQLHEMDKCNAKMHYLSRSIAKKHGIIPSAILTGFAYKLRHHKKNQWNGRWWYYDPIEVLRTHRWPYLSDGCLCENIGYLCSQGLLIKACNNKLCFDRTSWYAMDDDVRDAALSDLVWYDVPVAKRFKDIFPALIYHNVRFHVREVLKSDPDCAVPHHKLNKARLARELPMSESTAKRCVQQMVEEGIFVRHPSKRNLYTLADESQYRKTGSGTNANGSTANANGSSTNGSTANANRSTANAIGSGTNANGSTANDNAQYETSRKLMRNHLQTSGRVMGENSPADDKVNHKSFVDHQYVADAVGSFPFRGKEETDVPSISLYPKFIPTTFNQLMHQTKISNVMLDGFDEARRAMLLENYQGLCEHFIDTRLDVTLIHGLWGNNNCDAIVGCINKPFADYILEESKGWHEMPFNQDELWQLLYYPQLETLVQGFSVDAFWSERPAHTMPLLKPEVRDTTWALICKLHDEPSLSAKAKTDLFKEAIIRFNKHGWELRDGTKQKEAVVPTTSGLKKITEIFELNPEITAAQLFHVLDMCVDTYYMEDEPDQDKYDPYWHVRQGKDLDKLVQWLDKIIQQLDIYADCPITNYLDFEKRRA